MPLTGATTAAAAVAGPARRRWRLPAAGALLLLILLLGNAAGPYLFRVATLQSEIATQVRVTTGLDLRARGHARFDLLPSPHITMSAVHISDPSGMLVMDAASLRGDVRLLPLLVGRVELAAATLVAPRLVIDLDKRAIPPDSLIGRAAHAAPAGAGDQRLGSVTLVGGTAALVSRKPRPLPRIAAINATVDWRDLDSPATLTGSMRVAGTDAAVAAWVEQPSALLRGEHSAATLRLRSTPLDLSLNGDVGAAETSGFKGHISASAPSLAAVLALCGFTAVLPAPFADLSLNGEATLLADRSGALTLDLPSLTLGADGSTYEGALAYQDAGTPLLTGTLATDRLALAPFLARMPALLGPGRAWSTTRLVAAPGPGPLHLDLRISASHLRLPPVLVDDAAFSVMTRGDRVEIALNEGRIYGGSVKGRVSVGATPSGVSLRGAGSLEGADASAIGWDLAGRQLAAGSLSGTGSFETEGPDVAALVAHLKGWGRGAASGGDITGTDLGLGLRTLAGGRPAEALAALRSGRTAFRRLSFDLHLDDGVATLDEGSLQGRDASLTAGGRIDLNARRYDLHAVASGPGASDVRLPIAVDGPLDRPSFHPRLDATQAPAR